MFALLIPLLAQLPGLFGSFFKQKNDLLTAQNAAALQIEIAKLNLAGEIAKAQMAEEAVIVNSTGAYFKYFTFFMWFGPYMMGLISPALSHDIFQNMAQMPEWYVQSCMLIMFTVWGISVSADTVGGIFTGLGSFFQARRDHKLDMAKVNRVDYYDALRHLKGSVSQQDVTDGEKILDAMDKADANGQ